MKKLLSVFLLSFVLILSACGSDDEKPEAEKQVEKPVENEKPKAEKPVEKKEAKPEKETPKAKEEPKQDKVKKDEPAEEDTAWDDLKEKEKIIGVSDKDFSKVTKSKPSEVRNDSTGNWRITKISENIDIEEYALSYADLNMKDDEVHHIVNFNYHTTTWLNKMNGLLYVDIKEYVKKEEHDAKKLGSGMLLKSYVIFPDGDIQELDE